MPAPPMPPHPYTFGTEHMARLKAEVAELGPDASSEKIATFCKSLVAAHPLDPAKPRPKHPHIASATYNPATRAIDVKLHGGLLGFPVALAASPPKAPPPAVKVEV